MVCEGSVEVEWVRVVRVECEGGGVVRGVR
jgi:hypothetical protein